MRRLAWMPLVLFSLAPVEANAADAPALPVATEERVDVALHLVDVVVTDRSGAPLLGLTKGDFDVRVDGESREIATFDGPRPAAPSAPGRPRSADAAPAADPASAPAAPPRWIVVLFDADRISPQYRQPALETARRVAHNETHPGDRVAVALYRRGQLEFMQNFVPPAELPDALFADPSRILSTIPSFTERTTELMENVMMCRTDGSPGDCAMTGSAEFVTLTRKENQAAIAALRDLVASLAPLPGRKALVLIGDGFLLQPGAITLSAVNRISDSAGAAVTSRLADPPTWDWESLQTEASRAHVSVFTLRTGANLQFAMDDAQGRWTTADTDRRSANPFGGAASMLESSLRRLAEATGGRAGVAAASAGAAPAQLAQLEGVYTLGVPVMTGDTIRAKLVVKTKVKGAKIVAPGRLNYRGTRPQRLAGRLEIEPDPAGGAPRVVVVLDTTQLAIAGDAQGGNEESRVALYYRLLDASGRAVQDTYALLAIPRRAGQTTRFVHPIQVSAGAGRYVASVAVSDLVGHAQGTFDVPLALGSP